MRKNDIKNINDIFTKIMESVDGDPSNIAAGSPDAGGGAQSEAQTIAQLYSYGPDKLRINEFKTVDTGETIVKFFTLRPSDTENDKLHNAEGPAVIFGEGGDGKEYYFIQGEEVDGPEDPRFINAANKLGAASSKEVQDVFGDVDL